jgi:hypothetical protein
LARTDFRLPQLENVRLLRTLAEKTKNQIACHNCGATNQTNSAGKAVSDQGAGPGGAHFLKSRRPAN